MLAAVEVEAEANVVNIVDGGHVSRWDDLLYTPGRDWRRVNWQSTLPRLELGITANQNKYKYSALLFSFPGPSLKLSW